MIPAGNFKSVVFAFVLAAAACASGCAHNAQSSGKDSIDDDQLASEYKQGENYFVEEKYNESADAFAQWAAHAKEITPEQYFVVASAHAQARRFAEALPFAQKAVDSGADPKESWLSLLLSVQFELDHDAEVAAVLERLAQSYP